MDLALDGVEGDGVVRRVGCEDRYGTAGGKGINRGLVGFRVAFVVWWVGIEGGI